MKKIVLLAFVLVLLLPMTVVIHFSAPVKAEPKMIYVDARNTGFEDGSKQYPYNTIQKGINAANPADTVFVYNGTYQEWNIVLNKDNLSLIGENRDITIIDGMSHYWVLIISAQNVTVTDFTIKNSPSLTGGFWLNRAIKSKISNNVIKNHDSGIYAWFSNGNVIENNWISDNNVGIILSKGCKENKIRDNNVTDNTRPDFGGGVDLTNGARHNDVENNIIVKNKYGIIISYENNSIFGNLITKNDVGIYEYLEPTRGYKIFHNNFINNTKQVDLGNSSVDAWDNGLEGNYWSDYNGTDFDQDGVGDTPNVINKNSMDHFPLMGMFSDFPVIREEKNYHITLICNSSISALQFDQVNKVIRFNVTGEEGIGFCRICIPHELMEPPYTVTVDGHSPEYVNYGLYANGTHRWIYFTYQHSTQKVEIVKITLQPPFWTERWFWTILAAGMLVLAGAVYFLKKRKPLKPTVSPPSSEGSV